MAFKPRLKGFHATVLCLGAVAFFIWIFQPAGRHRPLAVYVITAEAADQSFSTMTGVGEVIRNRGKIQGFSVLKKDLPAFFNRQPVWVRYEAEWAWRLSRWTRMTGGATHFENVQAFGPPPWEFQMRKTAHMGDLQFYRRKK